MAFSSINPSSARSLSAPDQLLAAEVESAVEGASNRLVTWRQTTLGERSDVLANAAAILRARPDEFARPLTLEMGRRIDEAHAELRLCADVLDYYALNAGRFLDLVVDRPSLGVILFAEGWNAPYSELARRAAPNLMAGNVVMVPHSGEVPQCAINFASLLREAGAPPHVYANLRISREQAEGVNADPRVKGVALTGREEASDLHAFLSRNAAREESMDAPV